MSGYLEVKYPFRSNLGLNPFKVSLVVSQTGYLHCAFLLYQSFCFQSWKRQWCILRPSATCGGGSLAVYCSEAGAPAGTVELPSGCVVKRTKSRTRPHAFAVFSVDEPCKPRVLLAASSLSDAQLWMEKIRNLLNTDKLLGKFIFFFQYLLLKVTPETTHSCLFQSSTIYLYCNFFCNAIVLNIYYVQWYYLKNISYWTTSNICKK